MKRFLIPLMVLCGLVAHAQSLPSGSIAVGNTIYKAPDGALWVDMNIRGVRFGYQQLLTANILPAVPLYRTLTINGVTFDLSQNRTWNIVLKASTGSPASNSPGTTGDILVDNFSIYWYFGGRWHRVLQDPTF